jgi:hypothetical protein
MTSQDLVMYQTLVVYRSVNQVLALTTTYDGIILQQESAKFESL